MEKLSLYLFFILIVALTGCHTPQIVREDVSFEGLKTFYVEPSQNGEQIFSKFNNQKWINHVLTTEIVKNLTEKGFVNVAKKEDAQIIFVPVWSVSIKESSNFSDAPIPVPSQMHVRDEITKTKFYATLELQAFIKGDSHWGWRGFSPIETSDDNITTAMLKNQITWTLEFFPPEKHPNPSTPILEIFSSSNVTESEIQQQKLEQEERKQAIEKQTIIEKAKNEGKKVDETSLKNIDTPETVDNIEKSFEKALLKRKQK